MSKGHVVQGTKKDVIWGYFLVEVNKYIASNVLKISAILRVCSTSETAEIFST